MAKTVWIDLENSPHVPFFLPWITWLREEGHRVLLTARDLSQTHELLRLHGLEFDPIGGHGGGSKLLKAGRTVGRAQALVRRLHRQRIDLALGHGSRAQVVAAWWMRIPSITFLDYEYVSLRLFGLLCTKVFFPDAVAADVLVARGIPAKKLDFYPGFKEQVYLDPEIDRPAPVSPPLILIRPPARRAHYHTEMSERLYQLLVEKLAAEATEARVLFLPRYADDVDELQRLIERHPHFSLPQGPEPTHDLLRKASLVISGGGTMVREAAVLGIPAVSFFGGPVGGVDRSLEARGRLVLLRAERDAIRLAEQIPQGSVPGRSGVSRPESPEPQSSSRSSALPSAREVRAFLRQRLATYL